MVRTFTGKTIVVQIQKCDNGWFISTSSCASLEEIHKSRQRSVKKNMGGQGYRQGLQHAVLGKNNVDKLRVTLAWSTLYFRGLNYESTALNKLVVNLFRKKKSPQKYNYSKSDEFACFKSSKTSKKYCTVYNETDWQSTLSIHFYLEMKKSLQVGL